MKSRELLAIVGMGCRFPGSVRSPAELWKLLVEGVDAITEIPANRWNLASFYHPDPTKPGRACARWGGFLEGVDEFDAQFFGISPREAAMADPQQRLLLEVAYEALEDAGIPQERIAGSTGGVFVGISSYDYGGMQYREHERSGIDAYTNLGAALCIAANRISYLFDLHGPSLAVDTACSSSLVAAHLACQSIWERKCEFAFVAGVNLILRPEVTIGFSKASMLAPDGRCKSFDARANGYVRAEGCGVVIVKPLSHALEEHDTIYAVIRATVVNQDGRTDGISVPNEEAQEAMLREALREAGISADGIQYVEAHGTGTPVGDPIEARALGNVLGKPRAPGSRCLIGSIKSNIGHLESASGIAGLIKAALCLEHGQIPRSLHFETPNPEIPFDDLRLRVVKALENWPDTNGHQRRASINSFGFGGTNAHVVLESAPERAVYEPAHQSPLNNPAYLLPFSAQSAEALRALVRSCAGFFDAHSGAIALRDISYTCSLRRTHHDHRLSVVTQTRAELVEHLRAFLAQESRPMMSSGCRASRYKARLVFVCSGMGQQWWAMGRELFAEERVYRETIERVDALLQALSGWSILDELMVNEERSKINETRIAQPAIFSVQAALVALWRSWGMEPAAVVGHSVGEVAAAHIAGALTLEDAVQIVFHRSRLQQRMAGKGAMLAVGLGTGDAAHLLAGKGVSVAAINSPRSITLTGDANALGEIETVLNEQGVFCRFLRADVPYHSPMMDPLRQEFMDCLRGLNPQPARTPLFSTTTGAAVAGSELDADYWWRNIRNPVQFHGAMMEMIRHEHTTFLEIGAHPILSAAISECLAEAKKEGVALPSIRRNERERATILGSVGRLYSLGAEIEWRKLHPGLGALVKLPSYPWQHEKYWHESERSLRERLGEMVHPLLGARLESAHASWKVTLDWSTPPYLSDHRVQEMWVYPAAAYVEMALAAAQEVFGPRPCALEDVEFRQALLFKEGETSSAQVTLDTGHTSFEISSQGSTSSSWVLNSSGKLLTDRSGKKTIALTEIRKRCQKLITKAECYRIFASVGLNYGPMFQGLERLWRGDGEALGEIRIPTCLADQLSEYRLHPVLLDCCFQVLLGAEIGEQVHDIPWSLYLPVRIEKVDYYGVPGRRLLSYARLLKQGGKELKGEIQLLDETGKCLAEIRGFTCRLTERSTASTSGCFYEYRWKLQPRSREAGAARNSDHLPSPLQLAERLREEAEHLRERLRRDRYYADYLPLETNMTAAYVVQALRRLQWDPARHSEISTDQLAELLGVAPEYRRLLGRLLRRLSEKDVASIDRDPLPLWKALWERFPDAQAELILIRECGEALPSFLRGESDPLSLIFPESPTATIEHYYSDSPAYRIYNLLVKAAIAEIARRLPEGRIIRLLEIGGGTGGMTSYVLPMLPPQRVQYFFTDLAQLVVTEAEQKFREYSFVQYRTLDIESDPIEQGFAANSFDVILASDVLNATRELQGTLKRVSRLLGSGGELVLVERMRVPLGTIMVFGLLKGWWLFSDEDLRGADPWVPPHVWQGLLERACFTETTFVTDCDDPQKAMHSVILTRGPEVDLGIRTAPATAEQSESWLLFADGGMTGKPSAALRIAAALTQRGDHVASVWPGDSFRQIDDANYQVRPGNPEDMQCLTADLRQISAPWRGIIYLWGLDTVCYEGASAEALEEAWRLSCVSLVHLVQALGRDETAGMPALFLVTRHTHFVPGAAGEVNVAQSPLFGLGRVIANEYPQLRCRMVDLATGSPDEIQSLVEELAAAEEEDEIAIRGEARYVHRLVEAFPSTLREVKAENTHSTFRIAPQIPGSLETLTAHPVARRSPGSGEVEIVVRSTGLNFKDVMLALGLLPEELAESRFNEAALGMECAGRIVAVGQGVYGFDAGDEVIACGPGCLSNHVTVDARFVAHKPEHLSFEEAATIPIAFLTAYYALHYLGRMQPRERVLIHNASGGVGLAAVQLAKRRGAEIFATAGTTGKRQLLQALGVAHVMDSRSLEFAEEVLELTRGEGVDIVLNSLAGDAISKSLWILRPYGRFLEIGKRDIYQNSRIGLGPFHKNLAFFSIDLAHMYGHNADLVRLLFQEIIALIEDRSLHPISYRSVPLRRVATAFRHMAQAKHIGKIVLSMEETEGIPLIRLGEPARFRSDGTYLITGGLGGIGLAVADWLVQNGARHLVLIGRSGALSSAAQAGIQSLKTKGAEVITRCADVTSFEQLGNVFESVHQSMPPLRGVVHAAMVLDDALIRDLTQERMWKVLAPKALGAWNVHLLTVNIPLDFFVLFSSFASLIGNPGQANYAAGNAFLDSLAYYRRHRGLPGLTVNWGPVADVGYVARNIEINERFEQIGMKPIPAQQMLVILGQLLTGEAVQVGVARIDWERTLRLLGARGSRRFADLRGAADTEKGPAVEDTAVRAVLAAAPAERQALLESFIREQLAKVLGTSANRLDSDQPLLRLGLDSLMALEMGSRVQTMLGVDLPPVDFLERASIAGLAAFVAEQLACIAHKSFRDL